MRYDLFVEERYNISRISDTYKKPFISETYVYDVIIDLMTFYNVLISKKGFLPYKVNYDVITREAWVDS